MWPLRTTPCWRKVASASRWPGLRTAMSTASSPDKPYRPGFSGSRSRNEKILCNISGTTKHRWAEDRCRDAITGVGLRGPKHGCGALLSAPSAAPTRCTRGLRAPYACRGELLRLNWFGSWEHPVVPQTMQRPAFARMRARRVHIDVLRVSQGGKMGGMFPSRLPQRVTSVATYCIQR
ncbi:hypothetical protein M427DRAFT_363138 [Gonapodya prolifera JEL478]|uniref:Uncharacterized protein n=1 Tax=Gonapodya prolifera (strain JEL478) TaxID=1344416 RepID=A0A139AAB7_GONPJ|nr:hypothetical protein M427DRAFT_363138 [Gonapodya prolifera JEL478]|eukprot:KXS13751.1 hypothetical protein M427DRAFT_363138 [Gonapodya prolifera JEL478]